MKSSNRKHHLSKMGMLALAASAFMAAPALANDAPMGAGEGLDPAQQVQMTVAPTTMAGPVVAAATDPTYTFSPASTVGPLTRAQVRDELANWRRAGLLAQGGEIGDTTETLMARQAYNEMQAEVITARWAEESQRMAKARETEYAAQLAREEIEAVLAAAAREQPIGTAAVDSNALGAAPPSNLPGTAIDGNATGLAPARNLPTDAPVQVSEPVMAQPPQELPVRQ